VVLDGNVRGHLGAPEVLAAVEANMAADGEAETGTADAEPIAATAAPSGASS
jgi:hypothetical protein